MNDPFALDLTIRLLMLGLGSAMFAGSFLAFINKDKNDNEFYKSRPENGFKRGYMMHVLRGPDPLDTALSLRKFKKLVN